jgi:hypothetical protein
MSAFEKIIPGAFLVCVALTACGDRTEREGLAHNSTAGRIDTVTQPNNMPAPQPAAPDGQVPQAMQGKDSRATDPLSPMDTKKEGSAMPEALHGNNHGSNSVGTNSQPETSKPADIGNGSPLKKSSLVAPKSPKIIWV